MKETKKATPKKTNTKSTVKPKVKDVEIEENFLDEEETDKRLVVFAVIAVLVILAIIVTLVIGCDRKKEEEQKKPIDDIVVPDKKEEEEDEGVDTKEIVRKVTTVYRGKKTKESDKVKKEKKDTVVEDKEYTVTYYLGDTSETKDVKEGEKAEKYVPTGYSSCKYYAKENFDDETEEFDMDQAITEDINLYLSCELITYHIVYDNGNTDEYTVEGNDITIEDENYDWFTEDTFENQVTVINKDFVADENNVKEENGEYYIYLFGKLKEANPDCEGDECNVDPGTTEPGTTEPGTDPGIISGASNNTEEEICTENCNDETIVTTEPADDMEGLNGENTQDPTALVEEGDDQNPVIVDPVEEENQPPEMEEPDTSKDEIVKDDKTEKAVDKETSVKPSQPAQPAPAAPATPATPTNNENENKTDDNSGEEKPEEGNEE